jgi:hypothetical protein
MRDCSDGCRESNTLFVSVSCKSLGSEEINVSIIINQAHPGLVTLKEARSLYNISNLSPYLKLLKINCLGLMLFREIIDVYCYETHKYLLCVQLEFLLLNTVVCIITAVL